MAELVVLMPRAKLKAISVAGHLPNIEQQEKFNRNFHGFLTNVE